MVTIFLYNNRNGCTSLIPLLIYTMAYSQEILSASSQNTVKVQLLVTTSKMTTDPKQSQIWITTCLWLVWFCLLRGGVDLCTCLDTTKPSTLIPQEPFFSVLRETQNFSLNWSSHIRLDWPVSTSPLAAAMGTHLYLDLKCLADSLEHMFLKTASFLFIHRFSSNHCILASLSTWSADVTAQSTLPNHT